MTFILCSGHSIMCYIMAHNLQVVFVDASRFLECDIYELPGENRLFYVIHLVDYLWDKAGSLCYIFLGQLTTDLSGTITVHVS